MSELPAGRELDALVAEKVMGWTHAETHADYGKGEVVRNPDYNGPQCYSSDIPAAMDVLDKLGSRFAWTLRSENGGIACRLRRAPTSDEAEEEIWWGFGDTVSLAVCRAALKAVGA